MKVEWIIDGEGPNPDWAPPEKAKDPVAHELYVATTPHTVRIPCGTVMGVGCAIGDADCWNLCFPDGSADRKRNIPGLVYCKPADDECRTVVDARVRAFSPEVRQLYERALKRSAVHRKEQIAETARKEAAREPLMPVHPWLLAAAEANDTP